MSRKTTKTSNRTVYADIQEEQRLKYLQEFADELNYLMSAVILNVFHGVARNIGIADPDKLAPEPPHPYVLKGFLDGIKGIYKRVKGYFGRGKIDPERKFVINGMKLYKRGKPVTLAEWEKFNEQVIKYMRPYLKSMSEEMSIKGVLLGMATAEMERQNKSIKNYGKKTLDQVENEYFDGYIPDTVRMAKEKKKVDKTAEQVIRESYDRAAVYVRRVPDDVRQAIQQQVIHAAKKNLTPQQLASNLYWMKDDVPELKKYSAQYLLRDWHRVAVTELAYIHSDGKLAGYEYQAKKSIKDPSYAVYFAFTGGTCEWCTPRHGTLTRMVPREMAVEGDDSLSAMGIKDPHTNIAIWIGKSNVGFKKTEWRICTPAHPWNTAHMERVYPDIQKYNPKSGYWEYTTDKKAEKFIPKEIKDELKTGEKSEAKRRRQAAKDRAANIHRKYEEYFEPVKSELAGRDKDGKRIVEYNGSTYVEVSPDEVNDRMDAWRKNRSLPIPVAMGTKDHKRIFSVK